MDAKPNSNLQCKSLACETILPEQLSEGVSSVSSHVTRHGVLPGLVIELIMLRGNIGHDIAPAI